MPRLFDPAKKSRDRKRADAILALTRGAQKIIGIYQGGGKTGLVIPEDVNLPFHILVHRENSRGAANGAVVVAEIITPGYQGIGNPEGHILEVLGDPNDLAVQTEIVIRRHDIPREFSRAAMTQSKSLSAGVGLDPDREDLRQIPHVTIDGETARDFDDAVAIEKTREGFRLFVSIADVSYYVEPRTPLDQEAYSRGTSVYFPSMVLPMLPERLSNDLCSLVPHQDRLTLTAILDFDHEGILIAKRFTRSIIRSQERLTYTIVTKILKDKDPMLRKTHQSLVKPLRFMAELAGLLERVRMNRGSIGFTLPEAEIIIDPNGKISTIGRRERQLSHKIIEEFMLAANEAVAATLYEYNFPALYRIHETPDPQKIAEFEEAAKVMGLSLPDEDPGSPAWFGRILALVADTPKEYIVNNLLLRTMKQARYSPYNLGHFGLAASYYTHFTSPIRRYPDLLVHRALIDYLGQSRKKSPLGGENAISLEQDGDFLSNRERVAIDAERDINDRLRILFMKDKIGETFSAVVSGFSGFGFFVELTDYFVSGAVATRDLQGKFYLDEKLHRLIGRNRKSSFQMGQLIEVTLKEVDQRRRWLNFVPAEKER